MKITSEGSGNDPTSWKNVNAENIMSFMPMLHLPSKLPQDIMVEEDNSKNETWLHEEKGSIKCFRRFNERSSKVDVKSTAT